MAPRSITLGGRAYRAVVEQTVAHDVYFMGRVRQAGLDSLPMDLGETPEQYAMRLLGSLMASEKALEIVGALLVPVEVKDLDWTPELAAQTAAHIGALHTRQEKAAVQAIVLSVLIPFLQSGLGSLTAIRESSDERASSGAPLDTVEPALNTASGAI